MAAATVALTSSVALGHVAFFKKKIKSTVTIQYTNQDPAPVPPGAIPGPTPADPIDFFSGDLNSQARGSLGAACLAGRKLKVTSPVTGLVGNTTTAGDGSWQLSAEDVSAGQYRAVTAPKQFTVKIPPVPAIEPGHKHTYQCGKDKSGLIAAGP